MAGQKAAWEKGVLEPGRAGSGVQVMDDEVYTKAAAAEQQSGGTESQNPDSLCLGD